MRRKSRGDTTLSDDEGSEVSFARIPSPAEQSHLLRRINGFAPSTAQPERSESASSQGHIRRMPDEDASAPGRQISGAPQTPSIRIRETRPDPTDPAVVALRQRFDPVGIAPKLPTKIAGWRKIQVESEIALRQQPWYQMAELVAGVAGVPITDLVYFEPPNRQPKTMQWGMLPAVIPQQFQQPQPVPEPAGLEPDQESPQGTPQKPRKPPNPFGSMPPTRKVFADKTATGASAQDALEQLNGDLQAILDLPAGPSDEQMRALQRRRLAIKMLQDVQGGGIAPKSEVFLNPSYTGSLRIGRDILRSTYPRSLGAVTVEALESSDDAAGYFSLIVGSVYSRGQFSGGRRPLRSTDYQRYGEGLAYGQQQFRFARYNAEERDVRRQITIDRHAMVQQQNAYASRAPWCPPMYPSGTADTLRETLQTLPGFEPVPSSSLGNRQYGL